MDQKCIWINYDWKLLKPKGGNIYLGTRSREPQTRWTQDLLQQIP